MLAIFWLLTALVWPLKTTHMHLCVCVCCLPWQRCCSERWLCCSRNDCLYSTLLLSFVAKNNPAPQDKEGSTEEVIPLPPSRNYPTLPPSLDLIFFSFIHYLYSHSFSLCHGFLPIPASVSSFTFPLPLLRPQWKRARHNASSAHRLSSQAQPVRLELAVFFLN